MTPTDAARGITFLRQWRKYTRLTQEEAADRFGIDRTTLGRIENGKLPYNQDFLEKAALVYKCDPEDLLAMDPTKPDPPKLVYEKLRKASPDVQKKAMNILEAFLRAS